MHPKLSCLCLREKILAKCQLKLDSDPSNSATLSSASTSNRTNRLGLMVILSRISPHGTVYINLL